MSLGLAEPIVRHLCWRQLDGQPATEPFATDDVVVHLKMGANAVTRYLPDGRVVEYQRDSTPRPTLRPFVGSGPRR
jgi:hypothetical protein